MDKSKLLTKFGKLFAFKGENVPILQGIHYAADGSAVVTNRYYMLRIRGVHSLKEPVTLHAKTGLLISGAYPDYSNAWPRSFAAEMSLGVPSDLADRIAGVTAVAKTLGKTLPLLRLDERAGEMHAVVRDDAKLIECRAYVGNPSRVDSSTRSVNAEYLLTALRVFAEARCDCIMRFNGPNEAIVLTGGDIDVLIVPFRTASKAS